MFEDSSSDEGSVNRKAESSEYDSDFGPTTFFEKHQNDNNLDTKSQKPGQKKK